jgi:hypothetical protein
VLVDPACFIEEFSGQLVRSLPLFAIEALVDCVKDPMATIRRRIELGKNLITHRGKYWKELKFLLGNHDGPSVVQHIKTTDEHVNVHILAGFWDGLTAGEPIRASLRDVTHDTFTMLKAGHLDFPNDARLTDIMLAKIDKHAASKKAA